MVDENGNIQDDSYPLSIKIVVAILIIAIICLM